MLRSRRDEAGGIALMVLVSIATVLAAHGATTRLATGVAMVSRRSGCWSTPTGRPAGGWRAQPRRRRGMHGAPARPRGSGEVPVLVAAGRLPRSLPARRGVVVPIALAVAFGLAIWGITGNVAGLLAGYGVWRIAQRAVQSAALRSERDRAVLLLAEVEASRDAQAEAGASGERARIAREMHDASCAGSAGSPSPARRTMRMRGPRRDRVHPLAMSMTQSVVVMTGTLLRQGVSHLSPGLRQGGDRPGHLRRWRDPAA